jgi:hypothetical protein
MMAQHCLAVFSLFEEVGRLIVAVALLSVDRNLRSVNVH